MSKDKIKLCIEYRKIKAVLRLHHSPHIVPGPGGTCGTAQLVRCFSQADTGRARFFPRVDIQRLFPVGSSECRRGHSGGQAGGQVWPAPHHHRRRAAHRHRLSVDDADHRHLADVPGIRAAGGGGQHALHPGSLYGGEVVRCQKEHHAGDHGGGEFDRCDSHAGIRKLADLRPELARIVRGAGRHYHGCADHHRAVHQKGPVRGGAAIIRQRQKGQSRASFP